MMLILSEPGLMNFAACLMEACAKFPSGILLLKGELGAGKTTLVRGMLRAAGFQGIVKSPTYTLVETYELPGMTIHHFDLYRLADPEELYPIGFAEYLGSQAWNIIEWPERAGSWLKNSDLLCALTVVNPVQRTLSLTSASVQGEQVVANIHYL